MCHVPTDQHQQLALSYIRRVRGTLVLLYVRLSVGPHSGGT